jgi:hypothetical protein
MTSACFTPSAVAIGYSENASPSGRRRSSSF